ncbi:MAG: thiol oxidoreductase [Colwellia sp.]|uniref:di-heme oxidoreductase family protein n=1 Tax=Colwellia sp. TaxID=56799 RepID=UPI0025BE0568|nr:di-heme oxidoredictase family protein [Colwellia sp.]NQZ27640.1 thiol oxidoreductase [Colwellia sp.]
MHKSAVVIFLSFFLLSTVLSGCGGSDPVETVTPIPEPTTPEPVLDHSGLTPISIDVIDKLEYLSGGDATVFVSNENAFSRKPALIIDDFQLDGFFTQGDHLFRTPDDDIGPILSTGSCQGCHLNDGRGVVPGTPTTPMSSMLVKLANGKGEADPMYGDQIQPFSIHGFMDGNALSAGFSKHDGSVSGVQLYGEAFPFIVFETIIGSYPDGTAYALRNPVYKVRDLSYGPFMDDIRFSARVAPQAFGVGLLDAIPQENLLALVDEDDVNGDGISGRASMVTNVFSTKGNDEKVIGRFAYKAQNPTVLQQVAGAYNGDMGVSTSVISSEPCLDTQLACLFAAEQENKTGDVVDLGDHSLALVEFYNRVLAVPARRGYDKDSDIWTEEVTAGRKLFLQANCSGCHTPRHVTGDAKGSELGELTLGGLTANTDTQHAESIAVLSNQTIYPYTNLLLHDMGGSCVVTRETTDGLSCSSGAECLYVQRCDGLADGVIQGDASGTEWKTPALWGLGLVQTVNQDASFLHDGRARTIEEAVLWHDGEAKKSKEVFMNYSKAEREQLLAFLKSL